MTRRIVAAAGTAVLALSLYAGTALAAANPSGTGQPSQSCDDQTGTPAGFLTAGFANAESRYANPDAQGGLASGNSHVVSQYDVACFQVSQPHSAPQPLDLAGRRFSVSPSAGSLPGRCGTGR